MKLILHLFLFVAIVSVDANTWPKHVPARISFDDLANGGDNSDSGVDIFWKTLREVGLLSITNIPGFNKQSMITDLEDCLHHSSVGAPEFIFEDSGDHHHGGEGHQHRLTLATRTLDGTPEDILVATKASGRKDAKTCGDLKASSKAFRESVQTVSEAIAARFGAATSTAVRKDSDNNNVKIPVESLINKGEHLEHFHSYYSEKNTGLADDTNTIDWHTDQGMMLLFTPGQHKDGTTPVGFFIKLGDGSTVEVSFDSKVDDLVIMLGDGVNQYINDPSTKTDLRAVPHAVSLPNSETPRLWYGRMVLPPPEAIHPSGGMTFADLRTAMIKGDKQALALGCASTSEIARELMEEMHDNSGEEELKCDETVSMLCWMRCMNLSDFDVTVESCEAESNMLLCANDSNEVWMDGVHSEEYYPRCLSPDDLIGDLGMGDMDTGEMDMSNMDMGEIDMGSSAAASKLAFGTALGLLVTGLLV